MIALTASRLFTPLESVLDPLVLIDDGVIVEVPSPPRGQIPGRARVLDFGDAILAPGLVDLHIHGSAGHDVMEDDVMEADLSALPAVEQFLAKHGVSSYFPTTVTAPLDQTLAALNRLA